MTAPVKTIVAPPVASNDVRPFTEQSPAAAAAAQPQSLRLVVEPLNNGLSFTYKLYDRATGALLFELPREEAAKIGQRSDYIAGQVISTTA